MTKADRHFWVTGYMGEGAARMLAELESRENITLLDKALDNRYARFLYYRLSDMTGYFKRGHALKKCFYPWYSVLKAVSKMKSDAESCIVFFNSGFCGELDVRVLSKIKKSGKNVKLVLYIVDPMTGFSEPEHFQVIKMMDLVYSINQADCEKYGFRYYPLIYSYKEEQEAINENPCRSDLYYLGSGQDRTEILQKVYGECKRADIKTDFHVVSGSSRNAEGIRFHQKPLSYKQNVEAIRNTKCLLEVMHKDFDNPTQRYLEAVVYNKKLLTNNIRTKEFAFYDPRYMQIFQTPEEIDFDFIRKEEAVDYGYQGEFSPIHFLEQIEKDLDRG